MRLFSFLFACLTAILALGCSSPQKSDSQNSTTPDAETTVATEATEVPPVYAVCVKGQPLFAPFNEGDIMDEGKVLRQQPERYAKFIVGGNVFDITYKEEKNKDLAHDESYINQYMYQSKDRMKGQLFDYADPKAVEQYLASAGDITAEGDVITTDYTEGIIVSADYLKGRSILKISPTTSEDPDEPRFDAQTGAKVEKIVGAKALKSRISSVFGNDEYNFGIITCQPNDKYGIAAWVLQRGDEVAVWTDTCVVEGGQVYWSNYDPDEYNEPGMTAVVKGDNGLDIYCTHMETDETANLYLMRQEGDKMRRIGLGGFYQMYE